MKRHLILLIVLLLIGPGCYESSESDNGENVDKDTGESHDASRMDSKYDDEKDAEISESGLEDQYVDDATIDDHDNQGALNVVRFADHKCPSAFSVSEELYTGRDTWRYNGLKCIAWDVSNPERALFDLINFEELCGITTFWRGYAYQTKKGELTLIAEWDRNMPQACGYCLYDFSFEVEDIEFDDILNVGMAVHGVISADHESAEHSTRLMVGESATGIKCKYDGFRDPHLVNEIQSEQFGLLHMPADHGECGEGLTVVELEDGYEICAATCSDNEPCPVEEVLSCQQGTCWPSEKW